MNMAKASQADLDMGVALYKAFDSMGYGYEPGHDDDEDGGPRFDIDDPASCQRALRHLIEVTERGSLMRVVWGLMVLLDPRNEVVNPDSDIIELHQRFAAGGAEIASLKQQLAAANDSLDKLKAAASNRIQAYEQALGLLSTLKGDFETPRLLDAPVESAREIHAHVTKQLAAAQSASRSAVEGVLQKVQAWVDVNEDREDGCGAYVVGSSRLFGELDRLIAEAKKGAT